MLGKLMRVLAVVFWIAVVMAPFVAHAAIAAQHFGAAAAGFAGAQAAAVAILAGRSRGVIRGVGLGLAAVMAAVAAARLIWPASGLEALLTTSGVTHAVLYGSLLALFGRTLLAGREPLATQMARRIHGTLTPDMARYTRGATVAWCWFFVGQLVLSAVLLAFASHAVWSLFVNVLDGPLVALMFAAEYGVRRMRFRNEVLVSPLTIIRRFGQDRDALGRG